MNPVLGLPVVGPLHPFEWVRPAGNTEMKVTQNAAQHAAKTINGVHRAMALDIGDGAPDLDTLYAAHDCVVAEARTDGSANLSLDFIYEGVKWRMVYAHNTLPHPVTVGRTLARGAVVGRMGSTNIPSQPVALHLHWQVGYWDGTKWVWVDPWPLLEQNQEREDMDSSFIPKPNRTVTVDKGARHRLAKNTTDSANIAIGSDPGGPLGFPLLGTEVGEAVSGNAIWYAYWRPEVKKTYYLHTSVCGPETPWEAVSDAAEIAEQQATINSQTARISTLVGAISAKDAMLDAAILHEKSHVDLSAALQTARSR